MNRCEDLDYTEEQVQVILGSVLGDGCLAHGKTPGANARLSITQGDAQFEYLMYKASLLGKMVTDTGIRPVTGGFGTPCHTLQTRSFPYLRSLRKEIYGCAWGRGKKAIKSWIYKIGPLGLAIWYMDDGSGGKAKQRHLSTHCFTYDEQIVLQKWLLDIFNTKTSIGVDRRTVQYFLNIIRPSTSPLFRTIEPYVPNHMRWKLPNRMIRDKVCDVCGRTFTPSTHTKLRCSSMCARIGNKQERNPRVEKVCKICGKLFDDYNHLLEQFCTEECRVESKRRRWQEVNRRLKNARRESRLNQKTQP